MPATPSVAPVHRPTTETDYIFTLPASLTGAPGAVVPVAEDAGLPIAVQIVARRWRDDVALRIAEALES
jgi:Asp-tRNA(Asn)/Glu-tRNA(Gln) amidotransferase A subunit family amidase